jgi:hypothetical protein
MACERLHDDGYTHDIPGIATVYLCEQCAERDRGSVAVGDGTLCRECINAIS